MHYFTSPKSNITAISNFIAMDHICDSVHSSIAAVLRDRTYNAASALCYLRTEYGSGFMLDPPIPTPIPTTLRSLNFSRHSIHRNAALPIRRASRSPSDRNAPPPPPFVDAPPPPPKMPLCPNDPLALCPLDDAKIKAQLRASAQKIMEKDPNWFKDIQEGRYEERPQPPPGPSKPNPVDQPTATGVPSSAGKEFWIGEDDPAGSSDQPEDQASAAPKVPPVHPDAHLPGWYPEWKEDMLKERDAMLEDPSLWRATAGLNSSKGLSGLEYFPGDPLIKLGSKANKKYLWTNSHFTLLPCRSNKPSKLAKILALNIKNGVAPDPSSTVSQDLSHMDHFDTPQFEGNLEHHSRIDDILISPCPNPLHPHISEKTREVGGYLDHMALHQIIPPIYLPIPLTLTDTPPPRPQQLVTPVSKASMNATRKAIEETHTTFFMEHTQTIRDWWDQATNLIGDNSLPSNLHQVKHTLLAKGLDLDHLSNQIMDPIRMALTTMFETCPTRNQIPGHFFDRKKSKAHAKINSHIQQLKTYRKILTTDPNSYHTAHSTLLETCHNHPTTLTHIQLASDHASLLAAINISLDEALPALRRILTNSRQTATATGKAAFMTQLSNKPKQAHRNIFKTSDNPTSPQTLQDPTTGQHKTSTNDLLDILGEHMGHLMAPPHHTCTGKYLPQDRQTAPPPWASLLDTFSLETKAQPHQHSNPILPYLMEFSNYQTCIQHVAKSKQAGPDGIPNELLTCLPWSRHHTIHKMFGLMWITGYTPICWKTSNTIMLYKKGDPTQANHYRPIGLNNTMGKLWTNMVTTVMSKYLDQYQVLSDSQEGFRQNRSTHRQLTHLLHDIEDAAHSKRDLFAAYFDFSSAFNMVDHDKLLQTMYDLGIPVDVIETVKGIYNWATTHMYLNNTQGKPIQITRGTIQGDTLSPLLFIIFIEPLLRWLQAGGRGYKQGITSTSNTDQDKTGSLGYADDTSVVTNTADNLKVQCLKVQQFSTLSGIPLNGAPYSYSDIGIVDKALWTLAKKCCDLHPSFPTASVCLPLGQAGLGIPSLMVDYAQITAAHLTRSLNDTGKLGRLTTALLHKEAAMLQGMDPLTLPSHTLQYFTLARQMHILKRASIQIHMEDETLLNPLQDSLPDLPQHTIPPNLLKTLIPLGITSLADIVSPDGTTIIPSNTLSHTYGTRVSTRHKVALNRLSLHLCSPPPPGSPSQPYSCHSPLPLASRTLPIHLRIPQRHITKFSTYTISHHLNNWDTAPKLPRPLTPNAGILTPTTTQPPTHNIEEIPASNAHMWWARESYLHPTKYAQAWSTDPKIAWTARMQFIRNDTQKCTDASYYKHHTIRKNSSPDDLVHASPKEEG
eukprot:gene6926-biopygen13450